MSGECRLAPMTQTITRVLIANRGEIARRIMRTAHAMGIGTVAVYANGDASAPFVREADQATALRGDSAGETYLDTKKILKAALATGADAIHPGYGFLAENAEFAQAVTDAGLIWIGPSPAAIAAMGDKLSAKRLMEQAGVPQLASCELDPGANDPGANETRADITAATKSIGYPLLVKASAGGGGKGMRVVEREDDLPAAIKGARREAGAAFGDDTVFLERWLDHARHIEIQVVGDSHGNLAHCFERECSIQRRHQKIIEEAPSPAMNPVLRQRMGEAALTAAKTINYVSTGTVEFLVQDDSFWFLEMNTRLQVEHPVTEAVTGLDLVREQFRIAQGEPLGFSQDQLDIVGHAIEARLYAEDPANGFLPATGQVLAWSPSRTTEARFDSGIEAGTTVGIEFDPMLAKVIVHAANRDEAARRLARVLETTRVQGVTTNRDFLVATLRTPEFLSGDTTTDFIERVAPSRRREPSPAGLERACLAATMAGQANERAAARKLQTLPGGWRNTRMPPQRRSFRHEEQTWDVEYRCERDGSFFCRVGNTEHRVRILCGTPENMELEIGDHRVSAELTRVDERWLIHLAGEDFDLVELPRFPVREREATQGGLTAPMPGKVTATHVVAGDEVEAGQLLLILEAMKMEHRITAPMAGVVSELRVRADQQVANGELLVVVEAHSGQEG